MIEQMFPKGDIIKGNVGTLWQNVVWDIFKLYKPGLYKEIFDWTIEQYKEKAEQKGISNDEQLFGLFSKYAWKEFFDKVYDIDEDTEHAIETSAYHNALLFFKAFNAKGSAQIVRDFMGQEKSVE